MRALYQYPTEAVLADIVGEVESSHGGKVDFPEFIEILVCLCVCGINVPMGGVVTV